MKQLVIGNKGQIGSAIQKILECDGYDIAGGIQLPLQVRYHVIHITIPYSEKFIETVTKYINIYTPELCIIHSTVPVGTCDKIGDVVYSPCRGVHPELEKGIRTFTKYFAGNEAEKAAKIFKEADPNMDCAWNIMPNSVRSLEAAKLWDTTQYGWNIILEKVIHKYCEDNGLDFQLIYTMFNKTYNDGYEKLGHPEYKKYILEHRDGKIGGHCVVPNLDLLDSRICDIIKELNS